MGKKTDTKKPAAPAKRAAKTPPAAEPAVLPEPPAPKAKKPAAKATAAVIPPKAAKPAVAVKAAKTTKPKAAKPAKAKPAYTHDDIALRAYFIAERRQKSGLPGDASQDWITAEKELAAEAKAAKKSKGKAG